MVLAASIGCALVVAVGVLVSGLRTLASAPDPAAQDAGQVVDSGEAAADGAGEDGAPLAAPLGDADAGAGGQGGALDPSSPGSSVLTLPAAGAEQAADSSTTVAATPPTAAPTTAASTTAPPATEAPATTGAPTTTAAPATAAPTTAPAAGLNAVELEVLRLTNELRANPAGPLARQKPMPGCVSNGFYGIAIDGATGHPTAVPALSLSEPVSVSLARDWSIQMDADNNFAHRPNNSASAIYGQLGINWSATGENIAWFSGYPDAQAAQIFFEGWRESDTGHYCALVAGAYTHIGVGYHKGNSKSWATQNFYRLQ
ncbi:MAG: CAP domain-containing protein [Actinomycetota bacterium]